MFQLGQKIVYHAQPEWGVGHVLELVEEHRLLVEFAGREGPPIVVSTKNKAVQPYTFSPSEMVVTASREQGQVVRAHRDGTYDVQVGNRTLHIPEAELRALPPKSDVISALHRGHVGALDAYLLRQEALTLDNERRADALGALFASRIRVLPHQLAVAQRVLRAPRPRFVLADEVGLGKTIEAGLVMNALSQIGLIRRVCIVAPNHLTMQWLVEMKHRFNREFALLDSERWGHLHEKYGDDAWSQLDQVITSVELLSRNADARKLLDAEEAFFDLVIIDEAHHLKAEKAYEAARSLARNSFGLLLLTATPMQLDIDEYQKLLALIDPESAPTAKELGARLESQSELTAFTRRLMEGDKHALSELQGLLQDDETLAEIKDPQVALDHLAETYSLSEHLIRNRRATVGGFLARRLQRHPVKPTKEERALTTKLRALIGAKLSGAPRMTALQRLESSWAATQASVARIPELKQEMVQTSWPESDSKREAFIALIKRIHQTERDAKVLVFVEARETQQELVVHLALAGVEALQYHGELDLVERDRQVARFRDPDGPLVLLSTEVGSEGRNFQFCHHLVCYDLPLQPAMLEQRIGRLDRIGQLHPIDIHCFDSEGSFGSIVLSVMADAVGVFDKTVGGLDQVLEGVGEELAQLAYKPQTEVAPYVAALAKRVSEARQRAAESYDPLLDLRSFDRPSLQMIAEAAEQRLDLEHDEDTKLDERLLLVARDLDEKLEDVVSKLARKIGIKVDNDEDVDAFQCAFHLGNELTVDGLAGIDTRKERTLLGSFWRDTAVELEDLEFFASGHPLVEALFGLLRDSPYGRVAAKAVKGTSGLVAHFSIEATLGADTHMGAKVAARHAQRFLSSQRITTSTLFKQGKFASQSSVASVLEAKGSALVSAQLEEVVEQLTPAINAMLASCEAQAQKDLAAVLQNARKRMLDECEHEMDRLQRALTHQRLTKPKQKKILASKGDDYANMIEALPTFRLMLDSVLLVLPAEAMGEA
jgi:ATP-dependent helicase HepA